MNQTVGNNGNQLVDVLIENELLKDGMTAEQIAVIAHPFMLKPHHLLNDNFWEDVFCRAEELGYKLTY